MTVVVKVAEEAMVVMAEVRVEVMARVVAERDVEMMAVETAAVAEGEGSGGEGCDCDD